MKKKILILAFSISCIGMYGQVGIGTLSPNNSSLLDIKGETKGVLIPRVLLQNTTDTTTIVGSVNNTYENSLLVYNTTNNDYITPGYYYWFNDKWIRLLNQEDYEALDNNTKNRSFQVREGMLIITDSDGNQITTPVTDLNTVTTLSNNGNGIYTYSSEDGTITTINITSDVQNNFQEIVNHTEVKNILETIVKNTQDVVKFDGNEFTYIDSSGVNQVYNITELIQQKQITTSIENGDYTRVTYTIPNDNRRHINWKVNVLKAKGAYNGVAASYGVVKELTNNPQIKITQEGELFLNNETINTIKRVSTHYSILDNDAILLVNANVQDVNVTLPTANQFKGRKIIIKKEDSNEDNYLNIFGISDGLYTALPYSGWEFVSDGTEWVIINKF